MTTHTPTDTQTWRELQDCGGWFVYCAYPIRRYVEREDTDWWWSNTRPSHPLYIGFTSNIFRRLTQHTRKPWWPLVNKIIVDRHETEQSAREHERRYITVAHPLLNVVHNRHSL